MLVARNIAGRNRGRDGFTVLELMSVIVVIMILITLVIPAYEQVRERLDKIACINNLKNLYVGANLYVQDHGQWPQVNPSLLNQPHHAYDEAWIEDLMPYRIGRGTWICPTVERDLGGPDYTQTGNYRADYVAMPFDGKHITPYQWPTAPWFVERGNVHGNGNLLIQSNGAVIEVTALAGQLSTASGGSGSTK
jgi:competence protein ComGC